MDAAVRGLRYEFQNESVDEGHHLSSSGSPSASLAGIRDHSEELVPPRCLSRFGFLIVTRRKHEIF
jgi:hypothetical protein